MHDYSLLFCSIEWQTYCRFAARKGLRKGDPISPLLFVLAMEYLSKFLKPLKVLKEFTHHAISAKVNLVHLGFADDLLLFVKRRCRISDCFV